jgi:NADP-dependent 3-hydroxy acid dehydrogenase YdfG
LVLVVDLSEQGAATQIAAALEAAGATPEILVNNAGFGLAGEAAGLDPAEQLAIVDLNVRTLVEMTLRFLPGIRSARGKILNVASIAAYFPGGPGMAAYYASKSFVLSFSLAPRRNCIRRASRSRRCVPATPRRISRPALVSVQTWTWAVSRVPPPWRSPRRAMPGCLPDAARSCLVSLTNSAFRSCHFCQKP